MKNKILDKTKIFSELLNDNELDKIKRCFIFNFAFEIFIERIFNLGFNTNRNKKIYRLVNESFCYFYIVQFFHHQLLEEKSKISKSEIYSNNKQKILIGDYFLIEAIDVISKIKDNQIQKKIFEVMQTFFYKNTNHKDKDKNLINSFFEVIYFIEGLREKKFILLNVNEIFNTLIDFIEGRKTQNIVEKKLKKIVFDLVD